MSFILAAVAVWLLLNVASYVWRARVLRSLPAGDRPMSLTWLDTTRAFLFEAIATAVALLSVPLDWIAPSTTDHRSPITDHHSKTRGTVLLIHDFGLNAGSFWLLRRRLQRAGWQAISMRHGMRRIDARSLAAELRSRIDGIEPAQQLVLLGHGFGGLIARLYGRDYGPLRVRRIVTLGAPHRGSVLSPLHGPMRAVLEPRGRLISYLEASDPVPQQFDVISLFSTFDAFVLPPANAEYPSTFNIQVGDVGHVALLFSAKVFGLIEENLAVDAK